MQLLTFVMRYAREVPRTRGLLTLIVLSGAISGVCNAALIALINTALTTGLRSSPLLVGGFAALCVLVPTARFLSEALLIRLSAHAIRHLRMHLGRRILGAPLRRLEELGAHRLLATLTDDISAIAVAMANIPILCMHSTIVLGCLAYLGWLSWSLLLFVLGFVAVGVLCYQLLISRALRYVSQSRAHWDSLFQLFRTLTEGIKELKLHQPRRAAFLSQQLYPTTAAFQRSTTAGDTLYTVANSWAQILLFVFIGLLLFVVPGDGQASATTLTGYTLAVLYMMAPLEVILNVLPTIGRANVALHKVEELGLSLASQIDVAADDQAVPAQADWQRLELVDVSHTYYREREEGSFTLGPLSLTLRPGELVFLVGSNGSGKTTLAKLLIGLYAPESGAILVDGEPVTEQNRERYRQNFAVVFSDFFVFDQLLGLDSSDLDQQAQVYLERLQLDHKVRIVQGQLSTTALSQGQRKRLALLTAYLEDRRCYVFDEWAADQDPLFRDVFYYELLPELRARGKSVLVISHDDRYFSLADRIVRLDYGQLSELPEHAPHPVSHAPQAVRLTPDLALGRAAAAREE